MYRAADTVRVQFNKDGSSYIHRNCTLYTFKNAIKNYKHILDLLIKNFNVHILNKIFHLKPVEPEIYESLYQNPSFVDKNFLV